jgi:hypothetical protein
MLKDVLRAVHAILRESTQFVRKELWQEHFDAENWDHYFRGVGLPEAASNNNCGHSVKR